jgi:hypothetical protein
MSAYFRLGTGDGSLIVKRDDIEDATGTPPDDHDLLSPTDRVDAVGDE